MTDGKTSPPISPFVVTPELEPVLERAFSYLQVGLPVHVRGPAGTGKTAMALHLAERMGRPITLIYGNEEFGGHDLAGGILGMRRRLMVDNFVHSVEKRVEEWSPYWVDARLLSAARAGNTLVYDEFTRSRAEANNILLSMLSEGVVEVPSGQRGAELLALHPNFRIILTSNPKEYAGVHKSQDALQDRLVTFDIGLPSWEGIARIVAAHTGWTDDQASEFTFAIRDLDSEGIRETPGSVRPFLQIARVVHHSGIEPNPANLDFSRLCQDMLGLHHPILHAERSVAVATERTRSHARTRNAGV